jgi:aspartate racemase
MTPVQLDQEHLRVVMWADPTVPDRTAALVGEGPSPLPALLRGLRWLERAGATCVAMPCNTAHAYRVQLQARTSVEILDMVSLTLRAARAEVPELRRIGVLATRGTRRAALYENAARALALEVVQVEEQVQARCVDPAISAIKEGKDSELTLELIALAVGALAAAGAQAVVAGCTEIPVALGDEPVELLVIDSTRCLVQGAIERTSRAGAAGRESSRATRSSRARSPQARRLDRLPLSVPRPAPPHSHRSEQ